MGLGKLRLADLVFDPRHIVFIPSLKAVVAFHLQKALSIHISDGLREVLNRLDQVVDEYQPECLILLDDLQNSLAVHGIAKRWGKKCRIVFISDRPDIDAKKFAESNGCEVHRELLWNQYLFSEARNERLDDQTSVPFFGVGGSHYFSVRIGKSPLSKSKISVFLKGNKELLIPPFGFDEVGKSIFRSELLRFDVFAVGHTRVLPLGKVYKLKQMNGMLSGLPIIKATLIAKKDKSPASRSKTRIPSTLF